MITSIIGKYNNEYLTLYGKKAVKVIFFLLFLSSLFIACEKFKAHFPIKTVKVYGLQHIDQQAMQHALMPLVSKGFFAIDVETIKDRLLKSPWVSQAAVQRVWPDKVLITVQEKTPLASWNDSSVLSTNGELFTPETKSYPVSLPKFVGPEGEQIQMLQYYQKLTGILSPLHFKIARFELTPERVWSLTFDNGIKLTAGYKDILTRMDHFVKVYPKIVGNRDSEVEYVDLRYPNGLAVRWKTVL